MFAMLWIVHYTCYAFMAIDMKWKGSCVSFLKWFVNKLAGIGVY